MCSGGPTSVSLVWTNVAGQLAIRYIIGMFGGPAAVLHTICCHRSAPTCFPPLSPSRPGKSSPPGATAGHCKVEVGAVARSVLVLAGPGGAAAPGARCCHYLLTRLAASLLAGSLSSLPNTTQCTTIMTGAPALLSNANICTKLLPHVRCWLGTRGRLVARTHNRNFVPSGQPVSQIKFQFEYF